MQLKVCLQAEGEAFDHHRGRLFKLAPIWRLFFLCSAVLSLSHDHSLRRKPKVYIYLIYACGIGKAGDQGSIRELLLTHKTKKRKEEGERWLCSALHGY